MRALVYSDLQATDGHERCFADPSRSLQLWRIDRFFKELKRIYREQKCDALFDLGDTTDDRSAIPVPVIDLLCDHLKEFKGEWNLKLVGNHEQWLRSPKIHAGKMFRAFFHVVDGCEAIPCGKVNILCISYQDDERSITDFLRLNRPKRPALLLGHFQVAGCQMPTGTAAGGFSKEALDFVNIGLLGHIHKPQTLGKLHYIGSPFQQDWGESGEAKRVAIVDIQGGRIDVSWVPLEGFPAYRQVSLDDFLASVKADSEDRYKVILKDIAEAERYYAHPLANRADEAIYDFEMTVAGNKEGEVGNQPIPRSKQDIMLRYLKQNPPQNAGVVLEDDAMLAYGDQISK